MSAVWNQQANDVFLEALEQPAAKREAFARRACGENPALWGQVRALLAASDEAGSFLETPATGAAACPVESLAPPGAQIGPYKLLQQIGEGGMGVVYMAEQHEPIERRVALKIIKPGMDTRQVIARFEAERQALALMNHPNIAKVFDAGTTGEGDRGQGTGDTEQGTGDRGQQTILSPVSCHLSPSAGRPYFVMELVRGIPITKYCDDNRLTPRQRLELFVPVCHAIQHAHQKGIIHRDIKPTNVLVAEYDNQPVPQIIDFGVAKATGPKLTEKTMFTGFGQLVGTLEYMSPEQAKLNQLDIDTRSDIYSLGVLLYELLTGSTPLEQSRLRTAAFDETLRIIREEEPLKPSTKLGISDTLPAIAANRGVKPGELRRQVRGDLDWIIIKTLDKERSRRYQTASELALDIQRFLQDKPVEACVPSVLYRLRKYARRHRMAVLTAGLIVLFLLLVIGGGAWMGRQQARRQSRINQEVAAAVREATLHGNQALSLVDAPEQWEATLTMAFSALKRAEALGEGDPQLLDPALRDKVHQLAARLEADERDRRLVETIERIRLEKSEPNFPFQNFPGLDAIPKYRHALASCGLEVGATPVDQAASWIARKHPSVRNELIAGLDDWRELESGNREQTWLSAVVAAADADPWRNQTRQARQRGDRATLEALAEQREILSQPPATVVALASALRECGARDSAAHLLRQAQQRHPDDFWINHTLAGILERVIHPPRPSEAVIYYRIAIALRPRNGGVYFDLGTALVQSGDRSAAMGAYQKAIELQPQYAQPRYRMAEHLNAISAFQKATELDPVDGESHTDLGSLLQASRLKADRQLAEAVETLRQAAADNPQLPEVHCALGKALYHQGRFPEALAALERGHELGSQRVNWRYPTAQWIREIRRRVELADKVSAILAGTQRPVDAEEGIELAQHCARKRLHLGAARLYEWSFSVDPDSAKRRYRLLAACAAAMAGCHRRNDASQLGEEESARWRKQAVAWLRVDLDAWAGKLGDKSQPFRESVKVTLQYIQGHPDLAGLREEEFLEQLPEPERAGYRQLWMDVETIFAEATNDRR